LGCAPWCRRCVGSRLPRSSDGLGGLLQEVLEKRALLRRGRQELQPGFIRTVASRFGPANRRSTFERRSIRVLDSILCQKEADGDHLSDRERARERDRRTARAQVLGLRMQSLTGDGELAGDAYGVSFVSSFRSWSLRHAFMMRKMSQGANCWRQYTCERRARDRSRTSSASRLSSPFPGSSRSNAA